MQEVLLQPQVSIKELLKSFMKIYKRVNEQPINESFETEMEQELEIIQQCFSITSLQATFLSYIAIETLQEEKRSAEDFIRYTDKDFSVLPDIIEAASELVQQKLLYAQYTSYENRTGTSKKYILHKRLLRVVTTGEWDHFHPAIVSCFADLLHEVNALFELRSDLLLTTNELYEEIEALIAMNQHLPPISLLESYELNQRDTTLFLGILHKSMTDYYINAGKLLNRMVGDYYDRIRFEYELKNGENELLKKKLIQMVPGLANELEGCRVESSVLEQFLSISVMEQNKAPELEFAYLIPPEAIKQEPLFFNEAEYAQIQTLEQALQEEQYQTVVERLKKEQLNSGLVTLLHGAPGTGKTALVKHLALSTGRHLIMVEMDKIKSAWLGESEKNMKKVFDDYRMAARHQKRTPILCFNEADAIIGKRIEVSRSIDQANNTVQNILLQQLEDFEGIFFATTNLVSNLDAAFERRFLYKIEFRLPEEPVRLQILKNAFPQIEENFLKTIAEQYALSGGQIKNIRKKMMVQDILGMKKIDKELLQQYFNDESSLGKLNKRDAIGFRN